MTEAVTAPPREQVALVADNVIGLLRSFGRARARMLAAAAHDVEWSAHVLLKCLSTGGSMRAGELAETIHSDPSTVSRQVAALVKEGLLERRADPVDGRASLLVLTKKAEAVLAEHDRIRLDYFARVVADWSAEDLATFAALLARFTTDYENTDLDVMRSRMTGGDATTEPSAGRNE